ncbi:hypothetical protein BDQ17DRAFT_1435687 [Cyathus striatus]|nr:hypothetical protein BDQ17DRAFT_1435687 [Cyathus striatus]
MSRPHCLTVHIPYKLNGTSLSYFSWTTPFLDIISSPIHQEELTTPTQGNPGSGSRSPHSISSSPRSIHLSSSAISERDIELLISPSTSPPPKPKTTPHRHPPRGDNQISQGSNTLSPPVGSVLESSTGRLRSRIPSLLRECRRISVQATSPIHACALSTEYATDTALCPDTPTSPPTQPTRHTRRNRLLFISNADLLSFTHTPLIANNTSASSEPPQHIPFVAGFITNINPIQRGSIISAISSGTGGSDAPSIRRGTGNKRFDIVS